MSRTRTRRGRHKRARTLGASVAAFAGATGIVLTTLTVAAAAYNTGADDLTRLLSTRFTDTPATRHPPPPPAKPANTGPVHYPRPPARTLHNTTGQPQTRPARTPDYRFLSTPDFLNSDIADLRNLPGYTPRQGLPNSWNRTWAATLDTIMDTFAAEEPHDVLVAGDLVEGHWGIDSAHTGIFGPTSTDEEKTEAIRRAADFYYSQWRERFTSRNLRVHAGLGDHELGDNPWAGKTTADTKRNNVTVFKDRFYANIVAPQGYTMYPTGPAAGTAFATYLDPEVLLVSVDEFEDTGTDVVNRLDAEQLAWLDRVLQEAEDNDVDWIIVQGHLPVLEPVRAWGSSHMAYEDGDRSPFWQTMARHHVDLYLNGEVHDVTAIHRDGITQISHGGIVQAATRSGRGGTNYVVGEVFGNKMFLRDNRFTPSMIEKGHRLWQTHAAGHPVERKSVYAHPPVIAHMVITKDNEVLYTDGAFAPYRP